ncbi:hypothetical protein [Lyngbya confervoides]|uniref:Uncharacterized protein n=1 Tax=Lyngbya confervoides BDU141951 TaxID=1574623 RepID=A0ABD4T8A8_9CYAN|nr:hypothetical protein [Lyngbya confervoides]MCM1984817.1 hypothetical protein [Lyngbya confervoides BDU141951]
MSKHLQSSLALKYLFLYSLLGYSAFLATQGQVNASGAILGGSVALYSLQKSSWDQSENQSEETEELQRQLLERQHELEYYKFKLIEADVRSGFQNLVNQNKLEIHHLQTENHDVAETLNHQQQENQSKAQTISFLESENTRLKEQIAKMEKDRLLTLKRSLKQDPLLRPQEEAAPDSNSSQPLSQ